MRVGFTMIGGGRGTGGYNYLLNLLVILCANPTADVTPILFVGTDVAEHDIAPFSSLPALEIVRSACFDRGRQWRSLLASLLLGADVSARRMFERQRIDVLFESARFYGWRLRFPVIAWIPDFQHRVLPHMFTCAGYWKRELGFRAQIAAGRVIMLSSDDARRACEHFYPKARGRTCTVRFAVPPGSAPTWPEARAIADSYGLPTRFFFMPNQLSKHKNHLLVIEALALLRGRGVSICIAASGKQLDERHPDHFPAVVRALEAAGLEGNLRLLGLIPYKDLAALMRASMSVLNPSLFEGWSTSVEEARSLGVPLLLSDLDVHHEQAGERAVYFDRNSAASLANALRSIEPLVPESAEQLAVAALRDADERVRRFAAEFGQLASDCVSGRFTTCR